MTAPRQTEKREKLAALHAAGMNDVQIAERMGVTRTSVQEMRTSMGLPAHPREGVAAPAPTRSGIATQVDRFLAACAAAKVAKAEESRRAEEAGCYGRLPLPPVTVTAPSSLERC